MLFCRLTNGNGCTGGDRARMSGTSICLCQVWNRSVRKGPRPCTALISSALKSPTRVQKQKSPTRVLSARLFFLLPRALAPRSRVAKRCPVIDRSACTNHGFFFLCVDPRMRMLARTGSIGYGNPRRNVLDGVSGPWLDLMALRAVVR